MAKVGMARVCLLLCVVLGVHATGCSEKEAQQCHHLAYCDPGTCSCPEGFWGDGYGIEGCQRDAASIQFSITIPMKQVTPQSKLLDKDLAPLKRDVKKLFNSPANFDSTFHHTVTDVLTGNQGGLLLVMNVLYKDLTSAKAALATLDFGIDAVTQQMEYYDAKLGRKVGAQVVGMPIRVTGDSSIGSTDKLPTAQLWKQETIKNVKTTIVLGGLAVAGSRSPTPPAKPRPSLAAEDPRKIKLRSDE